MSGALLDCLFFETRSYWTCYLPDLVRLTDPEALALPIQCWDYRLHVVFKMWLWGLRLRPSCLLSTHRNEPSLHFTLKADVDSGSSVVAIWIHSQKCSGAHGWTCLLQNCCVGGILVDAVAVRVYSHIGVLNVLKVVWGRGEALRWYAKVSQLH